MFASFLSYWGPELFLDEVKVAAKLVSPDGRLEGVSHIAWFEFGFQMAWSAFWKPDLFGPPFV